MHDALTKRHPAHLWQPGQSGNPGGRARGLERMVRDIVRDSGIDPNDPKKKMDGWKAMTIALYDIAMGRIPAGAGERVIKIRDRIEAFKLLYDRGFGKAKVTVDLAADIQQHGLAGVNVDQLDDAQFEVLANVIDTMLAPARAKNVTAAATSASAPGNTSTPPDVIDVEPDE